MTDQWFHRKPERVQAVQWRGDNADEMAALAGPDFDYDTEGDGDAALRTSKHSAWEPMYIGDWAVRGPAGLVRVDAADFAAQFEPDGAPAPAALPEPDFLPGYPGKLAKRPSMLDLLEAAPRSWTAEEIAAYRLDHCGNCRDAEFYGYTGHFATAAHAKHVPVIEDGHGPLAGEPCKCKTCAPAAAAPTVAVIWNGEDRPVPYDPRGFVCDLAAAACDAFNLSASTRERVGLFNGNGVELDEDAPLAGLVEPLVLRDRVVRA